MNWLASKLSTEALSIRYAQFLPKTIICLLAFL